NRTGVHGFAIRCLSRSAKGPDNRTYYIAFSGGPLECSWPMSGGVARRRSSPLLYNEAVPDPVRDSEEGETMSKFWNHFVSNGGSDLSGPPAPDPPREEAEALDAYSRVVVRVSEMLRPAVVNLRGERGRREASGSGILFTPDGFLLTNHHVIRGQERVRVRLSDGREFGGRVVGADPWTDLAVVQAEASGLPVT